jgi:hypothetical protein
VHRVSSGDKRTYHVPCLQLLLNVQAGHVTVDILPEDVLLHVFHFVQLKHEEWHQSWHQLVHVCRKWRSVIFGSPTFLDLRLVCDASTRVDLTGIWPPLPIIIRDNYRLMREDYDFGAAIVHPDRVCQIILFHLTSSQLQRLALAMQEQFLALMDLKLEIRSFSRPAPALPDEFLGGSAPRLQFLRLDSIPFPALPKLLPSTDLVRLELWNIPHSGYISPEAMVAALAVLANLRILHIKFESPLSRPDRGSRRPVPRTRTVLPALTHLEFHGISEYLEDLVVRIDAPLLNWIVIKFFHQLIFDIPRLAQFMRRTPKFQTFNDALMNFSFDRVQVGFTPPRHQTSWLTISCVTLDWQLSSMVQVFTSFFPSIDKVEYLTIDGFRQLPSQWEDDIENMLWLEFFQQFTTVKRLSVSKQFAQCIPLALQGLVGERVTDVLPALESLSLEEVQSSGPVREAIEKFVAARRLSGHPVVVSEQNR